MEKINLIGHLCPMHFYPSPVLPVIVKEGTYSVVYNDNDLIHIVPLSADCEFIEHNLNMNTSLKNFDPEKNRLFAESKSWVDYYDIENEDVYFLNLLKKKSFSTNNPFMRLSIAKSLKKLNQIVPEIINCIEYIKEKSPGLLPSWYNDQLQTIDDNILNEFPKSWERLYESWWGIPEAVSPRRVYRQKTEYDFTVQPTVTLSIIGDIKWTTQGLSTLFENKYRYKLIHNITKLSEIHTTLENSTPQAVIFNWETLEPALIDYIIRIENNFPKTKVMMISSTDNLEDIMILFGAGIDGYIFGGEKRLSSDIKRCINKVMNDDIYVSPSVINKSPWLTEKRDDAFPKNIEEQRNRELMTRHLIHSLWNLYGERYSSDSFFQTFKYFNNAIADFKSNRIQNSRLYIELLHELQDDLKNVK